MSALHHTTTPSFHARYATRLGMGAAVIGLSLLAPGCSQGGNPPGNAQNETAAAPAAVGATPAPMPAATGLGGRIAERRRTLISGAVSALQDSYAALVAASDTSSSSWRNGRGRGSLRSRRPRTRR